MFTDLDFRSHIPIYVQLVERVKQLIATGALQPGDQLPTVRQLASELRVNFNTVARAYRLLDESGVISTQQGRGTYVLEAPPPGDAVRLRQRALDGLSRHFLIEAHRMGFEVEEVQANLEALFRLWQAAGEPPEDDN
jgi:GntR family transcriptional regulator